MFANTEEFFVLLVFSLAVGASLGAFYDMLMLLVDTVTPKARVQREAVLLPHSSRLAERAIFPIDKRITVRDAVLFFVDLVFCIVSALAVIILLYHLNYGQLRAFSLISALAGFVIYRKTLGRPLLFLSRRIIMILKSVLKRLAAGVRRIFMALLKPIRSAIKAMLSPIYIRVKKRRTIKKARCIVEQMLENEEKRSEKRNKNNEKHKGIRAE